MGFQAAGEGKGKGKSNCSGKGSFRKGYGKGSSYSGKGSSSYSGKGKGKGKKPYGAFNGKSQYYKKANFCEADWTDGQDNWEYADYAGATQEEGSL